MISGKCRGQWPEQGVTNLLAGLAGTVPNIINSGSSSFAQTTGVASKRVGYCIGFIFIAIAFLPKLSGLLSTIPGPVMAGYLIVMSGTLFVDGARLVIQSENNRQRVLVAGVWLLDRRLFPIRAVHDT